MCRACSTRPTSLPGALTDGPGSWLLLTPALLTTEGCPGPSRPRTLPAGLPGSCCPPPGLRTLLSQRGPPASPVSLPQQPGLPQLTSSPAGRVVASLAQGDPTDL